MDAEELEEFIITPEIMQKLNDPDLLRRYVEEGKTFQEILGYSDEAMKRFYEVAHRLLAGQRYKEAGDGFVFLTTLNPYVPEYWLGLGMCEQLQQEYEQAIVAYAMVIIGNRHQPIAHYHTAACHHAMGDRDRALQALERCLEAAGEQEEFTQVRADAVRSRELLQSRQK